MYTAEGREAVPPSQLQWSKVLYHIGDVPFHRLRLLGFSAVYPTQKGCRISI
jgi:hypothetical protein